MPVSPADFARWARATGNKYPETAEEKIAAAPHAYEHARNLGKTGENPPTNRVGGTIFYRQPEALQDSRANSVFDAPVTPDNDVPKVSGTVDRTLTSEHYVNQEQSEAREQNRGRQIIDVLGKTALAAGGLAAGYALARNPSVQQAVQSGISNVDDRVSSFLGRFTTSDLNGPTTSQRYNQQTPTTPTQEAVQVAKGAPVGSPEKELLQTKPVTESQVISTSQTFGPEQNKQQIIADVLARIPITDYEREYTPKQSFTSGAVSKEVLQARALANRQELDALEQARAAAPKSQQLNIPGVNPILHSLRAQGDVDLSTGEILDPRSITTKQGWEQTPTYEGTQLDIPFGTTPEPSVGQRAAAFLNQEPLPSAQAPASGQEYQYIAGEPIAKEGFFSTVKYGGRKFAPDVQPELTEFVSSPIIEGMGRTVVVPREKEGPGVLAKVMQRGPGYVAPETVTKRIGFVQPFEEATVNRALIPGASRLVRLPGARDVEAAIATQQVQGTLPSGPYSSLLTQQEYQPAVGAVSGIEPRLMTSGEKGNIVMTTERQERLAEASQALNALGRQNKLETDPGARARTNTFLKQIHGLYDLTQDPGVLEAGAQMAMPTRITLPGGEVAATGTLFKPFGAVESQPGSVTPKAFLGEGKTGLTQLQGLTSDLIEHTQRLNAAKEQAYSILGVDVSNYKTSNQYPDLTEDQFMALPPPVQSRLEDAHLKVGATQNKLAVAQQFPLRYGMEKSVVSGFKYVPVVSADQEVVGMRPVPEEKTMEVLERYKLASGAGSSRIDVGGVGRRREELQSQYGQSLSPTESLGDPSPVLYKKLNPETNQFEIVHPDDVSAMDIITKSVIPATGQTPSAQRLLGQGDRPYRGLESSVISTASFDPAQREAILAAMPELRTPEGLVYAPGAMVSPGGGSRPSMGTRFDVNRIPPAPPGSARAQRVERVGASETALRQAGLGRMSPEMQYREVTSRPTTRPATAAESAFAAKERAKAAAEAALPASQTIPLEELDETTRILPNQQKYYFEQALRPDQFAQTELRIPGLPGKPGVRMTSSNMQADPTPFTRWTDYIDRALTVNPQTPMQWLDTAQQKALQRPFVYQPRLF